MFFDKLFGSHYGFNQGPLKYVKLKSTTGLKQLGWSLCIHPCPAESRGRFSNVYKAVRARRVTFWAAMHVQSDGPFYCGRFALPIWGQIICNHACQILSYNVYFILICKTGFQLIDLLLKREGRKAQQLAVLPSNLTGFSTTQQFPSTIKGYFASGHRT